MPSPDAFVDEVAVELGTWPGVQLDRRHDGSLLVRYERIELGVLEPGRGVAQLRFGSPERDALVEHGDASPAEPSLAFENVSHDLRGPADITAVLELFDRRYRELRGEDAPYSSSDPS